MTAPVRRSAARGRLAWLRCSAIVWVVVLLGLGLLACGADRPTATVAPATESPTPTPTSLPVEKPEVTVDRITYVSPEGDLFTINADGSDSRRLTGNTQVQSGPTGGFLAQTLDLNNFYTWPTWSPDGTRLAASRIQISSNGATEISIQVLDPVTGRTRTVYDNDFGRLIADGTPHYLYWSPDSRSLGFLASTPQGLSLFAADLESSDPLLVLETGAPLYFNWSGDGNSLIIHVGPEVKLLRKPFDPAAARVLTTAGGFRVPAISPDGLRLVYSEGDPSGARLVVAATDDPTTPQSVLDTGANSAFLWSPRGGELAVADQPDPNSLVYQRLRVVSADGSDQRTLVEEPLIAFYWSPDGARLAWVSLDAESRVFEWKVISRDGGDPVPLFRFQPTSDVFTMLGFFDQYAHSHSPWSPDSSHLVVAGTLEPVSERRNGHTPTGAQIFVLDATGTEAPREIASGTLAFWSWN